MNKPETKVSDLVQNIINNKNTYNTNIIQKELKLKGFVVNVNQIQDIIDSERIEQELNELNEEEIRIKGQNNIFY